MAEQIVAKSGKSKDELAELIFNLLEDINCIEKILNGFKDDISKVKDSVDNYVVGGESTEKIAKLEETLATLQAQQDKIMQILESNDTLDSDKKAKDAKKTESKNELNPDMLDKMMFMKERGKWQIYMFIVILFLITSNILIFGFLIHSADGILLASAISIVPFLLILAIIGANLKRLNLDNVFGKKQLEFTEFNSREDLVEIDLPK